MRLGEASQKDQVHKLSGILGKDKSNAFCILSIFNSQTSFLLIIDKDTDKNIVSLKPQSITKVSQVN